MQQVAKVASQLQAALANSNADEAARLAEQLAQNRNHVRLYAESDASSGSGGQQDAMEGNVVVAVTFQTGCERVSRPVHLVLPRAALVADLKAATLMSFDLPQEIQRCIVNGKLARDEETMADLLQGGGHVAANPARNSQLQVRIYLLTHDPNTWPPKPEHLESLKNIVRAERQRRSIVATTDEGSAGTVEMPQPAEELEPGWSCPECTFRNEPSRPGCHQCGTSRPETYVVPNEFQAEEQARQIAMEQAFLLRLQQERERSMAQLINLAQGSIIRVSDQQVFECPICTLEIGGDPDPAAARGIRLRECGHEVCSDCLREHALKSESIPVRCPCDPCQQTVTDVELAALLSAEELARLQRLGLRQAEAVIKNAFHCVTPNCESFVELVDEVNEFVCQVCNEHNCVTCNASHKDQTCKQYQDEMKLRAENDENARLGLQKLEEMITAGDAMRCPQCKVILQKKDGCDWLMCSVCKTELCWATRGPRWGPNGKGDTSGGCKCRVNNQRCHPQCMNCH